MTDQSILTTSHKYEPIAEESINNQCTLGIFHERKQLFIAMVLATLSLMFIGGKISTSKHIVSSPFFREAVTEGYKTLSDSKPATVVCAPGYFSQIKNDQQTCSPCSKGYFSTKTGSSACSQCPAGFTTSKTGSTSCVACVTSYKIVNQAIGSLSTYICKEGGGSLDPRTRKCVGTDLENAFNAVVGGLVRLPFHDAATYNKATGVGGPDGCVDLTDPDNGGLAVVLSGGATSSTSLLKIQQQYASLLSLGDIIALAGSVAVFLAGGPDIKQRIGSVCTCVGYNCVSATADSSNACVNFQYGRKDSKSCTSDKGRLPSSQLPHSEIIRVFRTALGFTDIETVALMGAHTVGRANLEESHLGFPTCDPNSNAFCETVGNWDSTPGVFDAIYFGDIFHLPWTVDIIDTLSDGVTKFSPKTFQWKLASGISHPRQMLNTDMALVWEVTVSKDPKTGDPKVTCGKNNTDPGALGFTDAFVLDRSEAGLFTTCKQSAFFQYVKQFGEIRDSRVWFKQWVNAYTKMTEIGYGPKGKKGSLTQVSQAQCL